MLGNETWGFHHTAESKQSQEEVMTWFKEQVADFYDSGIQKLVPRLKFLDRQFMQSVAFVN